MCRCLVNANSLNHGPKIMLLQSELLTFPSVHAARRVTRSVVAS